MANERRLLMPQKLSRCEIRVAGYSTAPAHRYLRYKRGLGSELGPRRPHQHKSASRDVAHSMEGSHHGSRVVLL